MQNIIRNYIQKYPDYPNRTLAKLIAQENPQFSIEDARSKIRYIKGLNGKVRLKKLKDKSMVTDKSTISEGLHKLKIVSEWLNH